MRVEAAHLLEQRALVRSLVLRAQLLAAGQEIHSKSPYLSCGRSSSEWRMISGIWVRMKTKVSAGKPKSLKPAQ